MIEGLAHHREAARIALGWGEARLSHEPSRVRSEENLLSNLLVINLTLQLPPALHLGQDPYRKGLPRERVKADSVRHLFHTTQSISVSAREHLFDDCDGLVQIIGGRDGGGDLFTIFGLGCVGGRFNNGAQQCAVGIRHG